MCKVMHATINGQYGTGDIASKWRGEKSDQVGNILWLAKVSNWDIFINEFLPQLLVRMELI